MRCQGIQKVSVVDFQLFLITFFALFIVMKCKSQNLMFLPLYIHFSGIHYSHNVI